MSLRLAIVTLILTSGLAGCAPLEVDFDYDPAADFSTLRAYAWMPFPEKSVSDPRFDTTLFEARIRHTVDARLASKGYQKVAVDGADFLVAYHTAVERKQEVETVTHYDGHGGAHWGGSRANRNIYWGGPWRRPPGHWNRLGPHPENPRHEPGHGPGNPPPPSPESPQGRSGYDPAHRPGPHPGGPPGVRRGGLWAGPRLHPVAPWGGYAQTDTYVDEYEEGSLLLDMIEAETGQLMWRGSARAVISSKLTQEKRTQRINEAIGKLLASFPPPSDLATP